MAWSLTNGICGIEIAMGRAFSPLGSGAGAHGASPHAGMGRAVGAFEFVKVSGITLRSCILVLEVVPSTAHNGIDISSRFGNKLREFFGEIIFVNHFLQLFRID
jgi:hypothetical protein